MGTEFKQIIKNIETLMQEKGFKQIDISEATGITPPSMSNYLSGKVKPTVEVLIRIAEALDVPVVRLFTLNAAAAVRLNNQYVKTSERSIQQTLDTIYEYTKALDAAPAEAIELLKRLTPKDWALMLPIMRGVLSARDAVSQKEAQRKQG